MSYKPKTSQYAVAFIDFLGVKEMMANDADGHDLIVFQAACDAATHMYRKILSSDEEQVTLKMFSDNILLCRKIHGDDVQRALQRVAMAASMFQYFILETMGCLVRGGVTVGELYIDNMMVWGKSLVTAYKLESEKAVYPRIILDPDLPEELVSPLFDDELILTDSDGIRFLNYIHTVWKFHRPGSYESALETFQSSNLAEMSAHSGDEAVRIKRRWQELYLDEIWKKWLVSEALLTETGGRSGL